MCVKRTKRVKKLISPKGAIKYLIQTVKDDIMIFYNKFVKVANLWHLPCGKGVRDEGVYISASMHPYLCNLKWDHHTKTRRYSCGHADSVFSCPLSNHFLSFHVSIHLLEAFSPEGYLNGSFFVRKYTVESDRKYGREKEATYDKAWEPISHLSLSEDSPVFVSSAQGGVSMSWSIRSVLHISNRFACLELIIDMNLKS